MIYFQEKKINSGQKGLFCRQFEQSLFIDLILIKKKQQKYFLSHRKIASNTYIFLRKKTN
jgi:protease II